MEKPGSPGGELPVPRREAGDRELSPDCDRCFGLCCVAPAFSSSPDFAIDKDAGEACPNLTSGFRCRIHERLQIEGFAGCVAYDCFGAGQRVSQVTFEGQDWRRDPEIAAPMFEAFMIMRQLHELLMYLNEALKLEPARPLHGELRAALEELESLTRQPPDSLSRIDVSARRREVNDLLLRTGELVRAQLKRSRR